jgi:hypothetical protein
VSELDIKNKTKKTTTTKEPVKHLKYLDAPFFPPLHPWPVGDPRVP